MAGTTLLSCILPIPHSRMNYMMPSFLRCAVLSAGVLLAAGSVFAGSYTQNFNTAAVGSSTLGDGTTISARGGTATTRVVRVRAGPPVNNALQMMATGFGSATASWKFTDLDAGKEIQAFDFNFTSAMSKTSAS